MGTRLVGTAAAIALALLGAPSAFAANEAGDDCVANAVEANRTMIPWNSGSSGLGAMNRAVGEQVLGENETRGVITGWKVRVGLGQASLPQRFELYRVLNDKEEYRQEFQTPLETIHEGENFFPVRIPVWAGANLGLYGPEGTFACNTGESLVTGTFEGSANVGEVRKVTGLFGFRTPLTVVVEHDRDGDGYGDESQDRCTELVAYHDDCPIVTFSVRRPEVKRRAILLGVTISTTARVQVSGRVGWGTGPSAGSRRNSHPPESKRHVIVALDGGVKEVAPGTTTVFRIPLPKAVTHRLASIDRKKFLMARLTATASDSPDLAEARIRKQTAWLPGRMRIQRHHRTNHHRR